MNIRVLLNGKRIASNTKSFKKLKDYGQGFYRNYRSFRNIFSKKTQERMDENLSNNSILDFRENYQNGAILSDVSYFNDGLNTKTGKSFFKLSLGTEVANNVVKHELWHLCMRPQKEDRIQYTQHKLVTFHGCQRITEKSKEKIDKGEAKDGDVIGYGSGLEEGMANITSILATIKEKAALYKNGDFIGYNKEILALADKYMETGKIDPKLGIYRGHYQVYEDIARLLIMVSRNDYMKEHPFSEVLASDEGIDGWIEHPVNKPYSSFIYSNVNADTNFEREWNTFAERREANGFKCNNYMEINCALDSMKEKIIKGGTNALSEEEKKDIAYIINNLIGEFYKDKLERLQKERFISKEKKSELLEKFEKSASIIISNMKQNIRDGRE